MGWWATILAGYGLGYDFMHGALWHGHEMLFGYTVAVLSGFLATGTRGTRLVALATIWVAGRLVVAASPVLPAWLVAVIDVAYLPALALLRIPSLWKTIKWPTIGFVPLLAALTASNILFHLGQLGLVPDGAELGLGLAVDLFTLMMIVIAGRLVPGYTRAMRIPLRLPKDPIRERVSVALMVLAVTADLLQQSTASGVLFALVAAVQLRRLIGWQNARLRRHPHLWVLHVGFAWLVIGLALRASAALIGVPSAADALHGITAGAIGILTLGMMTRLSRIHARRSIAPSACTWISYGAVLGSGLARVIGPVIMPENTQSILLAAAGLWIAAFALFLAEYAPMLVSPPQAERETSSTP